MRKPIAAAVSLFLLCEANAQTPYSTNDLSGMWFIQVYGYPDPQQSGDSSGPDKVADGSITFYRRSDNQYDCEFNITFNFDHSKRYGSAGGWAVESCQATMDNGNLSVQSSLIRANDPGYRPDNFTLRVEDGERMTGTIVGESDGRGSPFDVIFRRR